MLRWIKYLPYFLTQWIWWWIRRDQFKFCNILTLSFTITEFCILILLNMMFRRILIPEYSCLKWDKLWWINRQWHILCEVYLPLIQKNSLFNMHYLACFGKEEFHSARKVSLKKPAAIYVFHWFNSFIALRLSLLLNTNFNTISLSNKKENY